MFKVIFILFILYLVYVVAVKKIIPAFKGRRFVRAILWSLLMVPILSFSMGMVSGSSSSSSSSSSKTAASSSHKESAKESSESSSSSESESSYSESTESTSDASSSESSTSSSSSIAVSSQQEDIVANAKTKVYHTSGQHNYRINPANTVHFNSEAEAQAAGYRPSQR